MIPTNKQIIELFTPIVFNPTVTANGGKPGESYHSVAVKIEFWSTETKVEWSIFSSAMEQPEIIRAETAQGVIDATAAHSPDTVKARKIAELQSELAKLTA